ncbi:LysR substrate-binding domain-containing protein [Photobacterium sp. MCCC 1A19761]|uniref:LysR substrate-binding domain-containing protein n=1 Tax=Photobacterium sp. MCCC 1A19761 TaxID=3115000 RepID=UPI00307E4F4B
MLLNRGRRQTYWYFANGRQQRKVPVCGNVTSKGGTPLLAALLGDCGIAQLSSWMVADYVRRGELVVLLDDWVPSLSETTSGHVYAMYKASAYPNPLIRLFIDFLVTRTQDAVL